MQVHVVEKLNGVRKEEEEKCIVLATVLERNGHTDIASKEGEMDLSPLA
jgi:hypothetical protein